jgi:hypothetical protein
MKEPLFVIKIPNFKIGIVMICILYNDIYDFFLLLK